MRETWQAVVVGLGAMGSAALYHLGRSGGRVAGIDRFYPPHDQGSSHGRSRVIRQAYFESPAYVPLVLRAYELWAELEHASGRRLMTETGGLMIGSPSSDVFRGSLDSARKHGLEHVVYETGELGARFPQFAFDPQCMGLYETRAGVLVPERCIEAHLELAGRCGATMHFGEPVASILGLGTKSPLEVITARHRFQTERVVMCGGPWTSELIPPLEIPLTVERQVTHWFDPGSEIRSFLPSRFPVFVREHGDGTVAYGIPAVEGARGGVKFAFHSPSGQRCTPETLSRTVTEQEIDRARSYLRRYLPALAGRHLRSVACMYTLTPDRHFVIDFHPADPRLIIAAGFSGHGFKFASVFGEVLAELADRGRTGWDLSTFSARRSWVSA